MRYSGGATVAWLAVDAPDTPTNLTNNPTQLKQLDERLRQLNLAAVVIRQPGPAASQLELLGDCTWVTLSQRIQRAMDPHGKFAPYIYPTANSNQPAATAYAT